MGVFDKDIFGKSKHETAIARIRTFCEGKRTLVAFSGGKDSQCCYHLCQEAGIEFTAQYSITRFEPPELLQFVRANYPDCVFRRAFKSTLIDQIAVNGLPNRWVRWCCKAKHTKTVGFDISVIGVRAEESPRRAANWRAGVIGHGCVKAPHLLIIMVDVFTYLRHAPQGAFYPRFSRCFSTARKSILILVSQSKNHTPDYCDTENRIIAILKLFPPKGGKIISVTQYRGPECVQNHPFFYSLRNFSKLMFP